MIFDSVLVEGAIIVYDSGHCLRILFRDHPGTRSDVTARGAYTTCAELFIDEVQHAVEVFLREGEESAINGLVGILEDDSMTRGLWMRWAVR